MEEEEEVMQSRPCRLEEHLNALMENDQGATGIPIEVLKAHRTQELTPVRNSKQNSTAESRVLRLMSGP